MIWTLHRVQYRQSLTQTYYVTVRSGFNSVLLFDTQQRLIVNIFLFRDIHKNDQLQCQCVVWDAHRRSRQKNEMCTSSLPHIGVEFYTTVDYIPTVKRMSFV